MKPIRQSLRHIAYTIWDEVKKEIEKLLCLQVVKDSDLPWSSPILVVRKKMGDLRLCVDYRKLNDVMHKDAFPLPRCDDLIQAAGQGTPHFVSKVNLTQGFHQAPMSADASQKTAFITMEGHYQYLTMPYGLTCMPAVFQHLMSKILKGLTIKYVYWYIDDILLITPTIELHLEVLQLVFDCFHLFDMLLKPSNCLFFTAEMVYLGTSFHRMGSNKNQRSRKSLLSGWCRKVERMLAPF